MSWPNDSAPHGGLRHPKEHRTRISLRRPQCGHSLEEISLLGSGTAQGPWTPDVTKVGAAVVRKSDKVQILTAPLIYREAHCTDGIEKDSAALVSG